MAVASTVVNTDEATAPLARRAAPPQELTASSLPPAPTASLKAVNARGWDWARTGLAPPPSPRGGGSPRATSRSNHSESKHAARKLALYYYRLLLSNNNADRVRPVSLARTVLLKPTTAPKKH